MGIKVEMNDYTLDGIRSLLTRYDEELTAKMLNCADLMADWADASQTETRRYAEKYALLRKEKQLVFLALSEIDVAIDVAEKQLDGQSKEEL